MFRRSGLWSGLVSVAVILALAGVSAAQSAGRNAASAPSVPMETQVFTTHSANAQRVAGAIAQMMDALIRSRPNEPPARVISYSEDKFIVCGSHEQIEQAQHVLDRLDSSEPASGSGSATVRLQVLSYLVRVPIEKVPAMDLQSLEKAAVDPAGFREALAALGESRPVWRVDQVVDLDGACEVDTHSNIPVIRGRNVSESGREVLAIDHQEFAARLRMNLDTRSGPRRLMVRSEIDALTAGSGESGPVAQGPQQHQIKQDYRGPYIVGRPIVLVSASPAVDPKGPLTICVTRLLLTPYTDR